MRFALIFLLWSGLLVAGPGAKAQGGLYYGPPRIIFTKRPAMLVLIDGNPRLRADSEWKMNVVYNSQSLILESSDGWFYLHGRRCWFIAPSPAGPFQYTLDIALDIKVVQTFIAETDRRQERSVDTSLSGIDPVEEVIVSTIPAELIQTKGEPKFVPVAGTNLLYVENTTSDLFLDSVGNRYYVLLSGRWFVSAALAGPWRYLSADSLPAVFRSIPEGSKKDYVLASVTGTIAANNAVLEARTPHLFRVDREKKSTEVRYDGPPKFQDITGTHLQYALNTASTVLLFRHKFYHCDKGIWFSAEFPKGPWTLCTERPGELDLIPANCPVYNCQFTNIYEVRPDYIMAGYTAGYLNSYISGGTIVYGTGYAYASWIATAYFTKPRTWGSGMWYSPGKGWREGVDKP